MPVSVKVLGSCSGRSLGPWCDGRSMALGEGDKWTRLQISTLLVTICVTLDGYSPFLSLSVLICKMGPILLYLFTWMSADTFIWGTLQKTDPFYASNILFYFFNFNFFFFSQEQRNLFT